jgi:ribonuclease Z
MATLHLLGTGAAVSDAHRTTTMLAVESEHSLIVIDCGGDVIQRLMASGVNPGKFKAMIITHEHPDHVSGFPLFMEKIWLLGRREAVPVYGIVPALVQASRIHDAFDTSSWPHYPEIRWHEVAHEENVLVFSDDDWHITASPGIHTVPIIGLRITSKASDTTLVYSADTEVSSSIAKLAQSAQILVHEATGEMPGHSSALGAAGIAARANVKHLILIHLPPKAQLDDAMLDRARAIFPNTDKGLEGGRYRF